jgi:hypothetical protein
MYRPEDSITCSEVAGSSGPCIEISSGDIAAHPYGI